MKKRIICLLLTLIMLLSLLPMEVFANITVPSEYWGTYVGCDNNDREFTFVVSETNLQVTGALEFIADFCERDDESYMVTFKYSGGDCLYGYLEFYSGKVSAYFIFNGQFISVESLTKTGSPSGFTLSGGNIWIIIAGGGIIICGIAAIIVVSNKKKKITV